MPIHFIYLNNIYLHSTQSEKGFFFKNNFIKIFNPICARAWRKVMRNVCIVWRRISDSLRNSKLTASTA